MSTTRNVFITALAILLTVILVGCGPNVRSLSEIKWSGGGCDAGEKINCYGYYKRSTGKEAFVFYEDGTLVLSSRVPGDTTKYIYGLWPYGAVYEKSKNRWELGANGVYRIEGDTIYANLYFENRFYLFSRSGIPFQTWMWKLKFHILDSSTILWLEIHEMDKEFPLPEIIDDTLHFYPAEQLPPPNTEMKRKRWLWKEKKDWKEYKAKYKSGITGTLGPAPQ